jgi:hypothetical protein
LKQALVDLSQYWQQGTVSVAGAALLGAQRAKMTREIMLVVFILKGSFGKKLGSCLEIGVKVGFENRLLKTWRLALKETLRGIRWILIETDENMRPGPKAQGTATLQY